MPRRMKPGLMKGSAYSWESHTKIRKGERLEMLDSEKHKNSPSPLEKYAAYEDVPLKTCPRCGAKLFEDMPICYECLYDFERTSAVQELARDNALGQTVDVPQGEDELWAALDELGCSKGMSGFTSRRSGALREVTIPAIQMDNEAIQGEAFEGEAIVAAANKDETIGATGNTVGGAVMDVAGDATRNDGKGVDGNQGDDCDKAPKRANDVGGMSLRLSVGESLQLEACGLVLNICASDAQ